MLVEAAQGQFNMINHLFCQSCAVHSLPAQIWCSRAIQSGMCEPNTASDMIPATTWSPSHPRFVTAVLGALSSTFQSLHLLHADPAMCDIKTLLSCSLFSPLETCIGRKQRTSGYTHLPKPNFWLKWDFCTFTGALTEYRTLGTVLKKCLCRGTTSGFWAIKKQQKWGTCSFFGTQMRKMAQLLL